jgi:hypothetical protein
MLLLTVSVNKTRGYFNKSMRLEYIYGLLYEKKKTFSDGKSAEEEAVKYNNFKWTCCKTNDTEQGTKKYYKCSFKRGSNCEAKIYLLFHASNFEVTLFQSNVVHDHTTGSKQSGIPVEVKNVIMELFQNGYTTPKSILAELDKLKITQPKASQISSFLVFLRKKLYGPAQISLNYIKNWCIEKSVVPDDPDECFVANYYIKDDDGDSLFRFRFRFRFRCNNQKFNEKLLKFKSCVRRCNL